MARGWGGADWERLLAEGGQLMVTCDRADRKPPCDTPRPVNP